MTKRESGGEYSREAYEAAKQEVEAAKKKISPEKPTEELREAVERKGAAEAERDRLHGVAQDEASRLNKEYGDLLRQKEELEAHIADFRREELGLPEEPPLPKPEKTKETEIKANIEFWRSLGIEVDEADVREKIEGLPEKEGYNFYLYMPKGIRPSQLWNKMEGRFPVRLALKKMDQIRMPRTTEESYAVAARYQQESERTNYNEIAQVAQNLEVEGHNFMTPAERMVAGMRWHQENGTHLDEDHFNVCPGVRTVKNEIPYLSSMPDTKGVYLSGAPLSYLKEGGITPYLGVRRVVTKES